MTIDELLGAIHGELNAAEMANHVVTCIRLHPAAIPGSVVFMLIAGNEGEIYVHPDDFQCFYELATYGRWPEASYRMAFVEELPVLHPDTRG